MIRSCLSVTLIGTTLIFAGIDTYAGSDQVPTHTTNKRSFYLPIEIHPKDREQIKEVQLHASTDKGKHWHKKAAVASSTKSFKFSAPGDGVYWFAVVTVAKDGKACPDPDKLSPMLIVHVKDSKQEPVNKVHGQWELQSKVGKDGKTIRKASLTLDESGNGKLTVGDFVNGSGGVVTIEEFNYRLGHDQEQTAIFAEGGPFKKMTVLPYTLDGDSLRIKGNVPTLLLGNFSFDGCWKKRLD
jgi:hypothetical protein